MSASECADAGDTTLKTILYTVAGGSVVLLGTLAVFGLAVRTRQVEMIAPRCTARPVDTIYAPKPKDKSQDRGGPMLGWIRWTLSLSYDVMLRGVPGTGTRKGGLEGSLLSVNLDAIVLMRFHALCLRVSILAAVLAIGIVLPLNMTAQMNFKVTDAGQTVQCNSNSFNRTTLANIPSKHEGNLTSTNLLQSLNYQSSDNIDSMLRLCIIVLCSWVVCFYTCRLIVQEWKDVLALRRVYYLEADHFGIRKKELKETLMKVEDGDDSEDEKDNLGGRRKANRHESVDVKRRKKWITKRRDPWIPHPEQRDTVPNVELYSVLVGGLPSLPSEVVDEKDVEEAVLLSRRENIDWQLHVTSAFFDHCVPNQPGFSSSVAAVTIIPSATKLATAWRRWIKAAKALRRLRFIRTLIADLRSYDIDNEDSVSVASSMCGEEGSVFTGIGGRGAGANIGANLCANLDASLDTINEFSGHSATKQSSNLIYAESEQRNAYYLEVFGTFFNEEVEAYLFQALDFGPEQTAVYSREFAQSAAACCPNGCCEGRVRRAPIDELLIMEKEAIEAVHQANINLQNAQARAALNKSEQDVLAETDDIESLGNTHVNEEASGFKDEESKNKNKNNNNSRHSRKVSYDVVTLPGSFDMESKILNSKQATMLKPKHKKGPSYPPELPGTDLTNPPPPPSSSSSNKHIKSLNITNLNTRRYFDEPSHTPQTPSSLSSISTQQPNLPNNRRLSFSNTSRVQNMSLNSDGKFSLEPQPCDMQLLESALSGLGPPPSSPHCFDESTNKLKNDNFLDTIENMTGCSPALRNRATKNSKHNNIIKQNDDTDDCSKYSDRWRQAEKLHHESRDPKSPYINKLHTGIWTVSPLRSWFQNTCKATKQFLTYKPKRVINDLQRNSTFAVVTFTSRQAAVAARHCLADGRGGNKWMALDNLPVPPLADSASCDMVTCRGCCRPVTLSLPRSQQNVRKFIAYTLLVLTNIFWLLPITYLVNMDGFDKVYDWIGLGKLTTTIFIFSKDVFRGMVQGILTTTFFALNPIIFRGIANFGSNAYSVSDAERSAMKYYWQFMLVTAFAGSSLSNLAVNTMNNWGSVSNDDVITAVENIAKALPTEWAMYWMNWMIIRITMVLPLNYLLQVNTFLFRFFKMPCCARCVMGGGPGGPLPYRIYIDSGVVFLCMTALSFVSPLVAPFSLIYFLISQPLWRRNSIFMYRQQYDGGGFRWPFITDMLISSLAMGCFWLAVMISLKDFFTHAFFAALPIPFLINFRRDTRKQFHKAFGDAGLLQTSLLDMWDTSGPTSMEQREEFRRFLVDAHKAAYIPVCIAGDATDILTTEPAEVAFLDRDVGRDGDESVSTKHRAWNNTESSVNSVKESSMQHGVTNRRTALLQQSSMRDFYASEDHQYTRHPSRSGAERRSEFLKQSGIIDHESSPSPSVMI